MFGLFRPLELRPMGGHPVASARDPAEGARRSAADEANNVVVAGVGSAGAAPAARFTKSGRLTVRLLDAGSPDKDAYRRIPAFSTLFRPGHHWSYDTSPQLNLGGRSLYWPRWYSAGRPASTRRSGCAASPRTTTSGPSWPGAGGRGTGCARRASRSSARPAAPIPTTALPVPSPSMVHHDPAPAHPHRSAKDRQISPIEHSA